jgi:hypothetical protein
MQIHKLALEVCLVIRPRQSIHAGRRVLLEFVCQELREKLQLTVRQVVVDPPRHRLPSDTLGHAIDQPGHDNRRQRAHAAVLVATIPHVAGAILFVRRAAQPMATAKIVDLWRTIR